MRDLIGPLASTWMNPGAEQAMQAAEGRGNQRSCTALKTYDAVLEVMIISCGGGNCSGNRAPGRLMSGELLLLK